MIHPPRYRNSPIPPSSSHTPTPPTPNNTSTQTLVARPYDRRGERAATRAAVAHLLVRRMRPFSSPQPPPPPPPPPQSAAGDGQRAGGGNNSSNSGGQGQGQQRSLVPGFFEGAVTLAAGMTGATVADPPSDMAFDPLGALLAVGTTHVRSVVRVVLWVWVWAGCGVCTYTRRSRGPTKSSIPFFTTPRHHHDHPPTLPHKNRAPSACTTSTRFSPPRATASAPPPAPRPSWAVVVSGAGGGGRRCTPYRYVDRAWDLGGRWRVKSRWSTTIRPTRINQSTPRTRAGAGAPQGGVGGAVEPAAGLGGGRRLLALGRGAYVYMWVCTCRCVCGLVIDVRVYVCIKTHQSTRPLNTDPSTSPTILPTTTQSERCMSTTSRRGPQPPRAFTAWATASRAPRGATTPWPLSRST